MAQIKSKKKTLKEVYAMLDEAGVPDDFLVDRDVRPAPEKDLKPISRAPERN